jgi:hypothetical protein
VQQEEFLERIQANRQRFNFPPSLNTVHLRNFRVFCEPRGQNTRHGSNARQFAGRKSHHGLHQPRGR